MTAFVPGHHSDLPTIPIPTSAASAAPVNMYVLARGFEGGAVTTARGFAGAAAAGPGFGTVRAISTTGAGAASPRPAGAGPTRLGPRRLDSTGPGPNCSRAVAAGAAAMPEAGTSDKVVSASVCAVGFEASSAKVAGPSSGSSSGPQASGATPEPSAAPGAASVDFSASNSRLMAFP